MRKLQDRVFLITGAGGNLGSAVTQTFHRQGAGLALVGRSIEKRIEDILPQSNAAAPPVRAYNTDVTDSQATETMVRHVLDDFGRIDGLVAIAGGYQAGTPVHETPLDTWDRMLNLNARSVFLTAKHVVPHMIKHKKGTIVTIGARAACTGVKNAAAYSASKSAVVRLTESLSAELKTSGIRVNCVMPGIIDTPGNRDAMPDVDFSMWVTPEDLAGVILFLCSDTSKAIHGAVIPVYGPS